jgi:hypothetical protein
MSVIEVNPDVTRTCRFVSVGPTRDIEATTDGTKGLNFPVNHDHIASLLFSFADLGDLHGKFVA